MRLGFSDGEFAEMKNGGRQHRGGMALAHTLDQMIERADPARGDNRNPDGIRDRGGQRHVKPGARSIPIHRGQQYFAGAERFHFPCPGHGIKPGWFAAAMGEYFPFAGTRRLDVDGDHYALGAVFF